MDVRLTLGVYEMTARNTPGVGPVLDLYGLASLPEAHCYLTYAGTRVDLTHPAGPPAEPIERFLHEETIAPEDIGEYKVALHESFVRRWSRGPASGGRGWRELLALREECIAALS